MKVLLQKLSDQIGRLADGRCRYVTIIRWQSERGLLPSIISVRNQHTISMPKSEEQRSEDLIQ